jgi:type I restriction enzyme M protein
LPDQLFYNTGINTYLWIVTNRKESHRKGKIQLIDGTSFFKKMRKSLGNKRNEICEDQRNEITRIYGDFKENEYCKIFDNEDFGYQRICVERPLKLNFSVSENRIRSLQEAKAFQNIAISKKRKDSKAAQAEIDEGIKLQNQIVAALRTLEKTGLIKNRDKITLLLKEAFKRSKITIAPPLFKAILSALSERDESADICTDSKGNPEPDSELRDFENVPLKEEIVKYMKREVLPHIPDPWIDESKTKIGYEINFNRYFYKYAPPRALEEIETDLKRIEKEIADMLAEVTE